MRDSIEKRLNHPLFQAVAVWAFAVAVMLVGWLLNLMSPKTTDELFPWSIAAAFLLLYAIMNSLLSLRADSFMKYWQASMYSYMALAFCIGVAARFISGIPIDEAGTYKWIFLVVTVGFLVFLSLINIVKKLVNFAEKEEWNQPRRPR